ncbi:MAG TPA: DUF2007 domain-containing protein [Xanthomarina sp.]|nr:DUF2007 domain-containing protein [Xanthomarina sp.]
MDRKLIFSGNSQIVASGVKNALDEANISYFEINKSDSSYPGIIGEIEIFVNELDEVNAKSLIKDIL